jgi:hypothetical protein
MINKTFTASLFIVLAYALSFGFQRSAPWQPFNSAEGKFSVLMPTDPELQTRDIHAENGDAKYYRYSAINEIGLFSVMYFVHPVEAKDAAERDARLELMCNGIIKNLDGEVTLDRKIKLYGYPGREFVIKKTEDGNKNVYQWKVFMVGNRLYQLAVTTDAKDSESTDVAKFFNSFALHR